MKSTAAWGWLVAGVLALGLNGVYHDGGAAYAQRILGSSFERIAARARPILALATGHADRFLNQAGMAVAPVIAREETASCRAATRMARLQTRFVQGETGFARFEAMAARQEAAMARVEANRARIGERLARAGVAAIPLEGMKGWVSCPRVHLSSQAAVWTPRLDIPSMPAVTIPQVNVEISAPSPI